MTRENSTTRKRVLVIRVGRLGDTVLATPIIEVLQHAFGPGIVIDFVSSPGASAVVLELDRRIHDVFPLSRRRVPWRLHPVKRRLRERSRALPYDLVVNLECGTECDDFHEFVSTREYCGRPLIQPRHIAGRHCVDTEKTIYADRLGREITWGADPCLQVDPDPEFQPPDAGAGFIVINPGFSGILKSDYRSHRGWPLEHWAGLIGLIRQGTGLDIAINGTKEEQTCLAPLLDLPGTLSLFGSSLQLLIQVLARARCVVSVDTGTMHLSAALGTAVVALFGPTIPELTGPYSKQENCSVLKSGLDCQPCFRTAEQKRCGTNRCMQELKPAVVYASVERALAPQAT